MTDTVKLSIPRDPQYYGVARLVVGGLAAGLSLSYDALDDLQLAIGSLLDNKDLDLDQDIELLLELGNGELSASVGPFGSDGLRQALAQSDEGLGLRRLLDTIVDGIDTSSRSDGEWVRLTKRVGAATA